MRGRLSSPDPFSGLAYKPAMCVASLLLWHSRRRGEAPGVRYIVAVTGLPANVSRLRFGW